MTDREEVERARSATEALAEIARAVNRATGATDAVQEAAEALQRHFRTWSIGIWLDGTSDHKLTLRGVAVPDDYPDDLVEVIREHYGVISVDSDLPGPAAMRARSTLRFSTADTARFPELQPLLEKLTATGVVAVPVLLDDEAFGCAVLTETSEEKLTPAREALLRNALGLIAIIFQRFQLLEREHEQSLRLMTLARVVEHIPLAVKIMRPDWTIEWANSAVRGLLGHEPTALEGRTIYDLRHASAGSVQDEIEKALRDGVWTGEVLDRHREGHPVAVHSTVVPVRNERNEIVAIVDLERDLAEDREREARMEDAYRMAAVGELAAGVAHEVNNPLQAIAATAELLLLDPLPEDLRSDLAAIRVEAKRGGMIVRNLLAFARPKPPAKARVDLGDIVDSVVTLRGPQIRLTNVALNVDTDTDASPIHADADQLKQVLHNLIGNASQAVQKAHGEGSIHVRVRDAGDHVELAVEDTGPGIPEDIRSKIFRPFFTTKSVGEGTGLGLAVSLKLVRENGGELSAENWGTPVSEGGALGEGGARFVARFPAVSRESASDDPGAEPPLAHRVLIIDDEPTVASVAARYLNRVGYEAVSAGTAEEALDRIVHGERYDAILVDLKMPGMGGEGFYRTLQDRHPSLVGSLMFASGDIVTPSTHDFLQATGRPMLAKPYALSELETMVRETIGAGGPADPS